MKKFIYITFQKEGIHKYPEAATNPDLADVSFLAYPHRHIFHFKVKVEVKGSNREIEFIQLKRWCEAQYNQGTLQLDYKSCEMMAEDLLGAVRLIAPDRDIEVQVSEDGENGAIVIYNTESYGGR